MKKILLALSLLLILTVVGCKKAPVYDQNEYNSFVESRKTGVTKYTDLEKREFLGMKVQKNRYVRFEDKDIEILYFREAIDVDYENVIVELLTESINDIANEMKEYGYNLKLIVYNEKKDIFFLKKSYDMTMTISDRILNFKVYRNNLDSKEKVKNYREKLDKFKLDGYLNYSVEDNSGTNNPSLFKIFSRSPYYIEGSRIPSGTVIGYRVINGGLALPTYGEYFNETDDLNDIYYLQKKVENRFLSRMTLSSEEKIGKVNLFVMFPRIKVSIMKEEQKKVLKKLIKRQLLLGLGLGKSNHPDSILNLENLEQANDQMSELDKSLLEILYHPARPSKESKYDLEKTNSLDKLNRFMR